MSRRSPKLVEFVFNNLICGGGGLRKANSINCVAIVTTNLTHHSYYVPNGPNRFQFLAMYNDQDIANMFILH
jgi:hypothetical protein